MYHIVVTAFCNIIGDLEFVRMFMLLLLVWFIQNFIESPEVMLTSSLMILESTEEATLQCTAVGGYPPIHNISLVKNGMLILSRVSSEVTYTTAGGLPKDVYGLYMCLVNNTAGTSSRTILLQHKG